MQTYKGVAGDKKKQSNREGYVSSDLAECHYQVQKYIRVVEHRYEAYRVHLITQNQYGSQ